MPMAVDPQQRIRVVLASDESKPEGQRPTFVFRHLTGREHLKFMEFEAAMDAAKKEGASASGIEIMGKVYDVCRIGLVGWDHMVGRDGKPIPFDATKLEDVIGVHEVYEMYSKRMMGGVPSDDDVKNSESPSPTDGAESVTPNQSASAEKEKDVPEAK